MADEEQYEGSDVPFSPEEVEEISRVHYKHIAEEDAKKADAASRRNATKRQARAEAKKAK